MKKTFLERMLSFFGITALIFAGALFMPASAGATENHSGNGWHEEDDHDEDYEDDGDHEEEGDNEENEDEENEDEDEDDGDDEDTVDHDNDGEGDEDDDSGDENDGGNTPSLPLTIFASKIVCADEADLPNWGLGGPEVTASTTAQFLATHFDCHLVPNWEFEWGYQDAKDPGRNFIGSAENGWHAFDSATNAEGVAKVEIEDLENSNKIWVREVLQSGYIPFTFDQENKTNADTVSAEMYCHDDVLNYDNYDWIENPELGKTYYCLAFNVLKGTGTTTPTTTPPGGGGGSATNTPPTISLIGENPITITVGGNFTDPGATAIDTEDGSLTDKIIVSGDSVASTTAIGTYTTIYSVTDSGGLSASTTRNVVVANAPGSGGGGGGTPPQCLDFVDNDGDGKIDAKDPGCHTDGNPDNTSTYEPFDNDERDSPPGGGSGGGVATSTPSSSGGSGTAQCHYLKEFIKRGANNNSDEVRKLQAFLQIFEGFTNLAVTGIYDDASYAAVLRFQEKYFADILAPWGHDRGTGFVYLTTRKKVNEIYCQKAFPLEAFQSAEVTAFRTLLASYKLHAPTAADGISGTGASGGVAVPSKRDTGETEDIPGVGNIGDIVGEGGPEAASDADKIAGSATTTGLRGIAAAVAGFAGSAFDKYWFVLLLAAILIFYFILRSLYGKDEEEEEEYEGMLDEEPIEDTNVKMNEEAVAEEMKEEPKSAILLGAPEENGEKKGADKETETGEKKK